MISVGTRSLLIGVHAFWLHPLVVARAWKFVHKRRPNWTEWVCIFAHDTGYAGCENFDGEQGRLHPEKGAHIAARIVYFFTRDFNRAADAYFLTLYHSRHYAALHNAEPSALFLPDKVSIMFEWKWFFLLRAKLSSEIDEYISNSPLAKLPPELRTPENWFNHYARTVREKLENI